MTESTHNTPFTRPVWSDKELLECVSVYPEGPNTCSFTFRATSGALFDFDPGQFLTLEIPTGSGTVHRTYTISSSPSRPRTITITAKAQNDSIGTRWMLDNLKNGMRLKAIGPSGSFSNTRSKSKKFLFISAGSGITPMMSMTTCLWDEGQALDIVFISCARVPSELLFRQSLEYMANRTTGLNLRFVVEKAELYQPWTGYQGRLDQEMLRQMTPDYLDREVYCCGPEQFMQSVSKALSDTAYDMDKYHQESFGAAAPPSKQQAKLADKSLTCDGCAEVHFEKSDVLHKCAESDTILTAAKLAGVSIPAGCTFGLCGTCKIKKVSGEVHMAHSGGISEPDIQAGYILACCSTPIGKVSVEI
ncbi:2Fe-2S iron-sulfur cluster-binding protein [Neptunomonas sp.]|uniref:2Fe-2S iron-sulfur cluster-binding protein n=1 Tax=Neptunomonas sp. TaxID=1971898 RepID=UPI003566F0B6